MFCILFAYIGNYPGMYLPVRSRSLFTRLVTLPFAARSCLPRNVIMIAGTLFVLC